METVNILLECINLIAIIIGFYFTAKELKESREQREQERKSIRLEHSIECSKQFADLINNQMNFIDACLSNVEYEKVINHFRYQDLKLFDEKEYKSLTQGDENLECYLTYISDSKQVDKYFHEIVTAYVTTVELPSNEFNKILALDSCGWKLSEEETAFIKDFDHSTDNEEEIKKFVLINGKAVDINYYKTKIRAYYSNCLNNLLNKLEYIAMAFNTNLADEAVVYQSLHQAYLKTIKYLYPCICHVNNGESADKYYTQIIELYNLWKDRYIEDQERIKEAEEKTRSKRVNAESKL